MSPILPRDILSMIYTLVAQDEIRARHQRWSHSCPAQASTLLKLARVDAWSYRFITDVLYRYSSLPNTLFWPGNARTITRRLLEIEWEDVQAKAAHTGSTQMSVHDPCIWPYLQRYHNLRRITDITLDSITGNLPCKTDVAEFLDHIGESGPMFRSVELSIACDPTNPNYYCGAWQHEIARYPSLFEPNRISFTAPIHGQIRGEPRFDRLFAFARLFHNVKICVAVRRLDLLHPNYRHRSKHVQPSNTWIQYLVQDAVQLPTTARAAAVDIHPDLEALYRFIKHDLIDRPPSTQLRMDVVLPGADPAELSRLSDQLVLAENLKQPQRHKARLRTVNTPTGCEDRLRDLRFVGRIEDL